MIHDERFGVRYPFLKKAAFSLYTSRMTIFFGFKIKKFIAGYFYNRPARKLYHFSFKKKLY